MTIASSWRNPASKHYFSIHKSSPTTRVCDQTCKAIQYGPGWPHYEFLLSTISAHYAHHAYYINCCKGQKRILWSYYCNFLHVFRLHWLFASVRRRHEQAYERSNQRANSYILRWEFWQVGKKIIPVDKWQVMLTKCVGQGWKELHSEKSKLVCQPFCKLSLSLAFDISEDLELSIGHLPGMEIRDWRLASGQINERQVGNPIENDQVPVINLTVRSTCWKKMTKSKWRWIMIIEIAMLN